MEPDEAKARLAEYEKSLKTDRNAEDEAIAQGYRAAARGLPVVQLSKCMDRAGWFDNGLPRLAVVRADAKECWVRTSGVSEARWGVTFSDQEWDRGHALVGAHAVRTTQLAPTMWTNRRSMGHCIVPLVPPRYRPRRPRLSRCHVLWEVEKWDPTPPVDPALLRHIRGDLWAVLATWDLTELERAVLSAR